MNKYEYVILQVHITTPKRVLWVIFLIHLVAYSGDISMTSKIIYAQLHNYT